MRVNRSPPNFLAVGTLHLPFTLAFLLVAMVDCDLVNKLMNNLARFILLRLSWHRE